MEHSIHTQCTHESSIWLIWQFGFSAISIVANRWMNVFMFQFISNLYYINQPMCVLLTRIFVVVAILHCHRPNTLTHTDFINFTLLNWNNTRTSSSSSSSYLRQSGHQVQSLKHQHHHHHAHKKNPSCWWRRWWWRSILFFISFFLCFAP